MEAIKDINSLNYSAVFIMIKLMNFDHCNRLFVCIFEFVTDEITVLNKPTTHLHYDVAVLRE